MVIQTATVTVACDPQVCADIVLCALCDQDLCSEHHADEDSELVVCHRGAVHDSCHREHCTSLECWDDPDRLHDSLAELDW